MEKTNKQPPVDREKLLIALECCRFAKCKACPYISDANDECELVIEDSVSYIHYLEEQLGVTGL